MLYLKEINYDDIEKEYLFVRDIPFDENGFANQWSGCSREMFDEVVRKRIAHSKGEELPEGLRLTLELAREIVPEEEIYLRVNKDNPASLAVMIKNGGRIDHEDDTKYYVRVAK